MRQAGRGGNPIQPCAGVRSTHTTDELCTTLLFYPVSSILTRVRNMVVLLF